MRGRVGCAALLAIMLGGCDRGPAPRGRAIPVRSADIRERPLALRWRVRLASGATPSPAVVNATAKLVARRLAIGLPKALRAGPVRVNGGELILPKSLRSAPSWSVTPLLVQGNVELIDWEASVLGPAGHPEPANPAVTGGDAAGVAGSGLERRAALARGGSLVQATTVDGAPDPSFDVYYAVRAVPALRGADFHNVRAGTGRSRATGNSPVLRFDLAPAAQRRMETLTRTIAERGARLSVAGLIKLQHFAVLVDRRVLTAPYVDFRRFPAGLDVSHGAELAGGLPDDAMRALAAVLETGPLPASLALDDAG